MKDGVEICLSERLLAGWLDQREGEANRRSSSSSSFSFFLPSSFFFLVQQPLWHRVQTWFRDLHS